MKNSETTAKSIFTTLFFLRRALALTDRRMLSCCTQCPLARKEPLETDDSSCAVPDICLANSPEVEADTVTRNTRGSITGQLQVPQRQFHTGGSEGQFWFTQTCYGAHSIVPSQKHLVLARATTPQTLLSMLLKAHCSLNLREQHIFTQSDVASIELVLLANYRTNRWS